MSMKNIEHVVVLMLENRSFDQMLGWLYEDEKPAHNIPQAKPGDEYRGLEGIDLSKFVNRADNGLSSPPVRGTSGFTVPSLDPGEEFEHVNMQFFETTTPGPDTPATMRGFLQDFVDVMRADNYSERDIAANAEMILQTYTATQLPVLNQLAQYYAVCDDWFASVPSQTNPNRAFLLTGTSHGLVDNGQLETDPRAREIEKWLGLGIGDDRFPETTIFNAVTEAKKDWAVFWQTSYLPHKIYRLIRHEKELVLLAALLNLELGAALFELVEALKPYTDYIEELSSGKLSSNYTYRLHPAIQSIENASQNFKSFDEFHDLARAGKLPKFSYIEPTWTIARSSTVTGLKNLFTQMGNEYHPPGNVIVAENFVKDVYASLIANQAAWEKTLLVITFDEFVGTFDHLSPPRAVPPWGDSKPPFPTHGFAFDRFGARVPTILVSPWIEKQTVLRSSSPVPFDHTSVIATVLTWLGRSDLIKNFGHRAANAPLFDTVLTRSTPRTDAGDIGFLDVARNPGDFVRYGDPILLKNEDGRYVIPSVAAMKVGLLPENLVGFAVDLSLAAYFPSLAKADENKKPQPLTLRCLQPDQPERIADKTQLFVVTLETAVGASNLLGAWADSHDCYYYDNYSHGDYVRNETWTIHQVDKPGQPIRYGDRVTLESLKYPAHYLSQSERPFEHTWLTTRPRGDTWTIEPAVVAT